jgi:ribosomal protein S18 acetylase RimI-like enzyme
VLDHSSPGRARRRLRYAVAVLRIERAGIHDMAGAYRTCLLAGDAGQDASALYRDPELLGHVYVGPYLARGIDTQLVLVDEQGSAGYLLSAFDTLAFEAWAEAEWYPPLRARYQRLGDGSPDDMIIGLIHEPERTPPHLSADYPAHLHLDLQERARGQGFGRVLIEWLLDDLRAASVPAVHLGVDATNANAIAFYEHLGFAEVAREPGGILMGRRLDR